MSSILLTGSSLKSSTIPAAFLEACLFLDNAEKTRNGANPGVTPKNNLSVTFSSDEGTATVAATLPVTVTVTATGGIDYEAKDYLGGTYAAFTAGGAVTAISRMAAVVQLAQLLSAAEKAVQPVEDQPNYIQVDSSSESGTITVTATLPVTQAIDATGGISIAAIDYL
jgi:hypothetical protein